MRLLLAPSRLLAAALALAAAPLAHATDPRCLDETGTVQLYEPHCCCTSGWCGPLEERQVAEAPGGWNITITPGSHPRLQPGTYYVPQERAQLSPDGRWHACGYLHVTCFLRVPPGM